MARKKSKQVEITHEQQEITYYVESICPYCGIMNESQICDDDRDDEFECEHCNKKYIIDISKLI